MEKQEIAKINIPDLSVVIVNWNTREELRACLRSITTANPGSMEIIIIDNDSMDDSVGMMEREFPEVFLIRNKSNKGFAKACNQGIAKSRGRYVLLLNPDVIVYKNAFSALIRFADENPTSGIVGMKILNPNGTLQYSCRHFPTLEAAIFRNTILGHFFPKNAYTLDYLMSDWDHSVPKDVDWVSGAALLMRRKFIDDVGMLDERFFMYCEDVDLGRRAKEKQWRVTYFPGAVVVHSRAKSSDKSPNRMILQHHKSMYRYFKKHRWEEASLFTKAIVPLGLVARAGFFVLRNEFYRTKRALSSLRNSVSNGGE